MTKVSFKGIKVEGDEVDHEDDGLENQGGGFNVEEEGQWDLE